MNTLAENAASGNTRGRLARVGGLALLIVALLGALLVWLNLRGEQGVHAYGHGGWSGAREAPAALIERGAYLARVGNCAGCHTAAGGAEYAGGRGLPTSFGTLYTSNLTPDRESGLGLWTAQEVVAVTAWLSSRPALAAPGGHEALALPMPLRCGAVAAVAGQEGKP